METALGHFGKVRSSMIVKYFDQFLATLLPIESEIIRVFRGQVLRPLRDDGTHLPPSTIFTQLQAWLI